MLNQMLFTSSYWTPASIPTVFWYDAADSSTITASGSQVTQVLDKSGNNVTLTRAIGQSGPLTGTRALNGLNVFEWTGNNCLHNTSFTHNQVATPLNIAMVVELDASNTLFTLVAGRPIIQTFNRLNVRVRATNFWDIFGGNGSADKTVGGAVSAANQPYIVIPKINSTNSAWRVNGVLSATGDAGTINFTTLGWGHNENEAVDLDGYFGEMIGFSDNTKQETIEGYLAWKWGIVNNLPAAHPYKTTAPRL